jgi:hypothetical protein
VSGGAGSPPLVAISRCASRPVGLWGGGLAGWQPVRPVGSSLAVLWALSLDGPLEFFNVDGCPCFWCIYVKD